MDGFGRGWLPPEHPPAIAPSASNNPGRGRAEALANEERVAGGRPAGPSVPSAAGAVRAHTDVLKTLKRHLEEFKVRRAAERAAAAAGTSIGQMYEADDECVICAHKLTRPEATVAPCGHVLHAQCFEQLFETGHSSCPICRTSLHRAGLIRVMNGLPTLNDFEVARLDPGTPQLPFTPTHNGASRRPRALEPAATGRSEDEYVVDLTGSPPPDARGCAQNQCSPPSGRTIAKENVLNDLDAEIVRLLRNCGEVMGRCKSIRELERSLLEARQEALLEKENAIADLENEKCKLNDVQAKNKLELRAEKLRLDSRAKSLLDEKREMEEDRAAVKKQMDVLLLKSKNVDELNKDLVLREETAKRKIADMEDKRDRFIRLKDQLEKESARAGRKSPAVLEKENKDLQGQHLALTNQVDALRRQLRKAKNMPRLPPRDSEQMGGDTLSKPPLFELGLDILARDNSGERMNDSQTKESESEEDVVAAADTMYIARNRGSGFSHMRDGKQQTPGQDSHPTTSKLFDEHLAIPHNRPQRRRRRAPHGSIGLSAFRPKTAKPVQIGSIGASRTEATTKEREVPPSGLPLLGKKRSFAPQMVRTGAGNQPPGKKQTRPNGKIMNYFQQTS